MKKAKLIIIFISVTILMLTLILWIYYSLFYVKANGIEVDSNAIGQSGYISDFVRLDDKLYYNYYGNMFNSGLYEISEQGIKKINSAEINFLPEYSVYLVPMVANENNVMLVYDNGLKNIDSEDKINTIDFPNECNLNQIKVFEGKIYLEVLYEDVNKLYCYQNDSLNFVCDLSNEIIEYYILEDDLYYVIDLNGKYVVYKCDLNNTNKAEIIYTFNCDANIYDFAVSENYAYIKASSHAEGEIYSVYDENDNEVLFRISNNTDIEQIYSGDSIYMLFSSDKLFFCDDENGAYVYDETKNITEKLTDTFADYLWAVDDKYVYFSDNKSNLYRVNQSGGYEELIFGK